MWTSKDLAVLVPMLGRPQTVEPVLKSLRNSVPEARVLFITSPGDSGVEQECIRLNATFVTIPYSPTGDYARKINAGFNRTTEPLIFTGACDLYFHKGWFEEAARVQEETRAGVVGTNDMGHMDTMTGQHSTHTLVTRQYVDTYGLIDEPGKVLYEGYIHEFVDDELVGTAKFRNQWAWAGDSFVEHLHPAWGKADWDESYKNNNYRMDTSRLLFKARRAMWTRR